MPALLLRLLRLRLPLLLGGGEEEGVRLLLSRGRGRLGQHGGHAKRSSRVSTTGAISNSEFGLPSTTICRIADRVSALASGRPLAAISRKNPHSAAVMCVGPSNSHTPIHPHQPPPAGPACTRTMRTHFGWARG